MAVGFWWYFLFRPADTLPARSRRQSGYFSYSDCGTRLYDFFLLFGGIISPRLAKVVVLLRVFRFSVDKLCPRSLITDYMAVLSFDVFPVP